jgi:hypothetical protein
MWRLEPTAAPTPGSAAAATETESKEAASIDLCITEAPADWRHGFLMRQEARRENI